MRSDILTRLAQREQSIHVEQSAHYEIAVTNRGEATALFKLAVVGLPESWLAISHASLRLAPGESNSLTLRVTPPRLPASRAGYYPFSVQVTSPAYPRQCSQQEVLLSLQPFYDFSIDLVPPSQPFPRWSSHYGQMLVPISNQSNRPLLFRLEGIAGDGEEGWQFEFAHSEESATRGGRTEIALQPGAYTSIPLSIRPGWRSLAELTNKPRPFTLTMMAIGTDGPPERRSVQGHLPSSVPAPPLFFASLSLGMALLLALFLWVMPDSATSQPQAQPAPALPATSPNSAGLPNRARVIPPTLSVEQVGAGTLLAEIAPLVPVVVPTPIPEAAFIALAEAIAPAPAVQTFASPMESASMAAPVELATPASPATITYEAMFKEIGERYDLDWRLLASMAYKESTLNPTAIGRDGDMGLMQIMPGTWDQIAPLAGVSDPYDPYSNALAGAAFLRYLIDYSQDQGHSELYWALLAYNWGPTNVQQHLRAGRGWAEVPSLKQQYVWEIMTEAATPSASWWQEEMQQPLP